MPIRALLFLLLISPLVRAGVPEISARVESLRGLAFDRPVEVVELSRSDLRQVLLDQIARDNTLPTGDAMEVLEALLLIPESSTALENLLTVYEAQVLAFYDPTSRKYYTFDAGPDGTPLPALLAEAVAIHELTHALQDQRFDAGRRLRALEGDWDRQMAYHAVLEGEATLLMLAAMIEPMGMTLEDLVASEDLVSSMATMAATSPGMPEDAEPYFVESMKFPYIQGLGLVIEAFRREGWKGVDALHGRPPLTTEEVLRPEVYFRAGHASGRPACSDPDSLVSTPLGRFHWGFLLGDPAADGMLHDCVQVSRNDGGVIVRGTSAWISETEAEEFARSLEHELEERAVISTVVRKGMTVEFRWGGAPPQPPARGSNGGATSSPSTLARASSQASSASW
ncbi:MAG: hypothetical protein ABR517_07200 [Thermoanaerobaculia bacterium]